MQGYVYDSHTEAMKKEKERLEAEANKSEDDIEKQFQRTTQGLERQSMAVGR
jgi:hypothetical protein